MGWPRSRHSRLLALESASCGRPVLPGVKGTSLEVTGVTGGPSRAARWGDRATVLLGLASELDTSKMPSTSPFLLSAWSAGRRGVRLSLKLNILLPDLVVGMGRGEGVEPSGAVLPEALELGAPSLLEMAKMVESAAFGVLETLGALGPRRREERPNARRVGLRGEREMEARAPERLLGERGAEFTALIVLLEMFPCSTSASCLFFS